MDGLPAQHRDARSLIPVWTRRWQNARDDPAIEAENEIPRPAKTPPAHFVEDLPQIPRNETVAGILHHARTRIVRLDAAIARDDDTGDTDSTE